MNRQMTLEKLHQMRLSGMAQAFEDQCNDAKHFGQLTFEDRVGMMVDTEWQRRKNNKLMKLIRHANFRYPTACMEDIEYFADRNLDRNMLNMLSTCEYIHGNHHVILQGATGCGKTFIACALGNAACRQYFTVKYIRIPDLLNEFAIAQGEGTFAKLKRQYQKINLLILDEFLLTPVSSAQARELLEIVELRSMGGSVIFCTQIEPVGWYTQIGTDDERTVTEAIIDRIIPNSYIIKMESKISMRKRHGINQQEPVAFF